MGIKILKKDDLGRLIASVLEKGGAFVAPAMVQRQVVFKAVNSATEVVSDYILPRNSYKEFVFPQTEVVAEFTMHKDHIDLKGKEIEPVDTVIFGARACEAATLASLRSVFTWDFVDEFYTRREDKTVVLSVVCTKADEACFCSTVNITPEDEAGSDVMLRETETGDYTVKAITGRGGAFIERHAAVFSETSSAVEKKAFIPEKIKGVVLSRIKERLANIEVYEEGVWAELARKCIGCGACTFVCPTCHCFDITDEGTASSGERRKNWDACQFDTFTLHASGHNPRDTQYKRWRNRFMCKFNFYPEKFAAKGCVGCGRCVRVCPVRLDITEVMEKLSG